ncbi:MAG: prepilin-type N-terminal cleavage/methylation domain-containing protein [Candidatus Magasanikbacteria bacterium]
MYLEKKGFTLLEVIVGMSIFVILSLGISWVLIVSLRTNDIVWNQLGGQNEARKVLQEVVNTVRRAESSSMGAYTVVSASETEFVFYANTDTDLLRERVRFWLDGTTLKMGVIKPGGNPLQYTALDEVVKELAHDVVNTEEGTSTFLYYDSTYTGTEEPLVEPVDITSIRLVRVQLEIEHDPEKTPVPLHVESQVSIRSLKEE